MVLENTVMLVPAVAPKVTAVAPVNPVPVIVTREPPAVDPLVGKMAVTVGRAGYVNRSAAERALVPPGAVTLTSTVPAAWAGDLTMILVGETTVRFVPAGAPNRTAVAPENPLPVMVTSVFPEVDP